jgi:hypothetical protein
MIDPLVDIALGFSALSTAETRIRRGAENAEPQSDDARQCLNFCLELAEKLHQLRNIYMFCYYHIIDQLPDDWEDME